MVDKCNHDNMIKVSRNSKEDAILVCKDCGKEYDIWELWENIREIINLGGISAGYLYAFEYLLDIKDKVITQRHLSKWKALIEKLSLTKTKGNKPHE